MKRLLIACLLIGLPLHAQDTARVHVPVTPAHATSLRTYVATGMVAALLSGSLVSSYYDWWQGADRRFHVMDDGLFNNYSLGIDKAGHAYTSYFYFHTFHNIMRWGGYQESTARWWAAGTAAFFAVSIEIGDGLSDYGFSFGDLAFNMGGLGYGLAQTYVPYLRNFNLKWSYVPQDGYRWPPRFTDHYDAHIYWLTVNVHNLLPDDMRPWWPEFLQLAVGYGVDDHQTRREGFIGLDLNLRVFRPSQPDLRLLVQEMDMFHIPMPGIKAAGGRSPRYQWIVWN